MTFFFGTTRPAETISFIASSMDSALSLTRLDSTTITRPVTQAFCAGYPGATFVMETVKDTSELPLGYA